MTPPNSFSIRCARQTAICLVIAFAAIAVWPQATGDDKPETVLLTDGTPVHLVLMDDLQGKKLQAKEPVHFKVRQDLVIDSKVVVKNGTEAIGHIESVSKSGLFDKSGKMVLQIDYVNSTSGVKILLRGGAGVNGGKSGALTWESAMWYGPEASLRVGTAINAYIDHDQRIAAP